MASETLAESENEIAGRRIERRPPDSGIALSTHDSETEAFKHREYEINEGLDNVANCSGNCDYSVAQCCEAGHYSTANGFPNRHDALSNTFKHFDKTFPAEGAIETGRSFQ